MNYIKLVISDVNNILTNGINLYNNKGKCIGKYFNDLDFTAIEKFNQYNVPVLLYSDDKFNEGIIKRKNLSFFNSKQKDKYLKKYDKDSTIYIGSDLELFKNIKYSFCPSSSRSEIRSLSYRILNKKAGEGILEEIFEYCFTYNFIDKSI